MKSLVIAAIAVSGIGGVAPPAHAAAPPARPAAFGPRDITGVWMQTGRPQQITYPLTPEYQAILAKKLADIAAGKPAEANPCVPGPLVRMMTLPVAPLEIARVSDDRFVVTKENQSIYRIYLNRGHKSPEDLTQGLYGDAVGHWEGDTLVVDTIGLGGSTEIEGRTPHSDAMHVIQRFRRISADTLENRMTIDDPKAFTHPVEVTATYTAHPDWELGEFFCTNERMVVGPDGNAVILPAN
ncbi:MAG TPA: hypothetical protein VL358_01950 [Caulobacteraceae bacterium]|jgi:hypothetical protein|nr:hypothetical protein [Caulobacteraceae bacterium]